MFTNNRTNSSFIQIYAKKTIHAIKKTLRVSDRLTSSGRWTLYPHDDDDDESHDDQGDHYAHQYTDRWRHDEAIRRSLALPLAVLFVCGGGKNSHVCRHFP
ncbi:hypothetical protein TNIN_33771 [Trichonephila inaurata madagascariensis]|uniref:Uncharacterized protein n=1 Tax=Trichonephila inaurata madagascariensis TaxID=2747483 RepID=A0A8X6XGY8_9ARAC|nr:hypothetical protein TNIN_33771 [Trichonephila inaurata madagascariensis]